MTSVRTMQGGSSVGKKVNALVQEQLQYCRSLRRADMLSTMQVRPVDTDSCCCLSTLTCAYVDID